MTTESTDFIRTEVTQDLANGRYSRIQTRFPPEPNGYLHIGHVKAIAIDFGVARDFDGGCNLRFDDTNPTKEEQEYVDAIMADLRWLGFEWDNLFFASDYFDQLYQWAVQLIKDGKAFVDDHSAEEIRAYRGTLTEPGRNSPYRNRSVEENLDLFERMKNGEFPDGTRVLRAKIDMTHPNMNMRDPVMYRILHESHHRTGDKWCIYPMYDWAHGQSDSMEQISHSLCSLEFQNHRPLYEWFLENLGIFAPRQIEFARLNVSHTITSKRKLRTLVDSGVVGGWDDPRMPTVSAMRRRGYTAQALRNFIDSVGIARAHNLVDIAMLEYAVRDELNQHTERVMAVVEPLKLVITNYPDDQVEQVELPNYPQDKTRTETRTVPFSKTLYIERSDFAEDPPRRFYRLSPGREVRLLGAYYVTCTDAVNDADGNVVEVHATYDPASQGGSTPDQRKVKGTIHWVSAEYSHPAELRLYDRLFTVADPQDTDDDDDFTVHLNPESLKVVTDARVEPSLATAQPGDRFQFMRNGYFAVDKDSTPENLVFNLTIGLRDTWAKITDGG
jgi:glutaminyl-tRNA synthetase